MKTFRILSIIIMISFLVPSISSGQKEKDRNLETINRRVDNNGYWKRMAEKERTTLSPMTDVPNAEYTSSEPDPLSSFTQDSPDIPVTTENNTQSENFVYIHPNDPIMAMANVPVTKHVADFIVTALADPEEVCVGETVQLDVEVVGGGGSYAYTWTSEPPGFNSTLKAPQVIPMENTTYTVHAADGTNSGSGSISVSVFDYPVVSIGPDTEICIGEEHIFDAGNGYASYEWQDGSDGTSFTASETGIYWVEVSNSVGCFTRDSAMLIVKQLPIQPAKPAGPSMLDLYNGNASVYLTSEQVGISDYTWVIEPLSAGMILDNEAEATVNWNDSFTGTAMLKVMTSNLCGNSIWSDKLEINITNTFGIHDLEKQIGVNVYPNPNNGSFSINLSTESIMKVNIYIRNSLSTIVYESLDVQLRGKHNKQISLGQLSAGVYTIIIEGKAGRLSRQVIVQE